MSRSGMPLPALHAALSPHNRVCTVSHAQWIQEGCAHEWHFAIEASRFLCGMVRAFVGTLCNDVIQVQETKLQLIGCSCHSP